MTDKQINIRKKALPNFMDIESEEDKREYAELACRDMINSIMIYGNINSPYDEKTDTLDKYLEDYASNESSMFYVPRERVIELVKEQQADFKNAVVYRGVYTDNEGCTYNSISWADEL